LEVLKVRFVVSVIQTLDFIRQINQFICNRHICFFKKTQKTLEAINHRLFIFLI